MIKFSRNNVCFELSDDDKTLTAWLPPKEYWALWEEYQRQPNEEIDDFTKRLAVESLAVIAEECKRLTDDGKRFSLHVGIIHLGAQAVAHAIH